MALEKVRIEWREVQWQWKKDLLVLRHLDPPPPGSAWTLEVWAPTIDLECLGMV